MKTLPLFLWIALLAFPQLTETLITPCLSQIASGLEVHDASVQYTVGLFFAAFAIGVSFWGMAADLWGRKSMMIAGLCVYILGTAGCALSLNVVQLYMATFIQAFGASCGSVVTQTMIRDQCEGKERAQLFALIGMTLAFTASPWTSDR